MYRPDMIRTASFPGLLLVLAVGAVAGLGLCAPGHVAAEAPSPEIASAAAQDGRGSAEAAAAQFAAAEDRPRMRKATSVSTGRMSRLKALARHDLRTGRFADAYHRLRPNVGEARGDSEYLGLLALAAMRVSSYGEAMVIYERLAEIEPAHARWRMGLAMAREQLGLDATATYREALALSDGAGEIRALIEAKLAREQEKEESFG